MPGPIVTKEMFGTTLKNGVDALNAEPEHRRIGLVWMLANESIWVEDGPFPEANLANGLGVCAEIAKHLVTGGIHVRWPYKGGYSAYTVTSNGIADCDVWG